MTNSPNLTKSIKKKFTEAEDQHLKLLIVKFGFDWDYIAKQFPGRTIRQCKERWELYLSPLNNNSKWTKQEDDLLLHFFGVFGTKWSAYCPYFERRTFVNIRNRCHLLLRKSKKQQVNEAMGKISKNAKKFLEKVNLDAPNDTSNIYYDVTLGVESNPFAL